MFALAFMYITNHSIPLSAGALASCVVKVKATDAKMWLCNDTVTQKADGCSLVDQSGQY